MKKFLLISVIGLLAFSAHAQLNNSWIDFNKTYYKFKLAKDTLTRIYQTALPAALANTPAQNFQLWRNGKEVRLYTSVSTGPLGASDYIEFWGLMNDGQPDMDLYRNPANQLSDHFSLESDTSVYFLTVNPAGNNLRYTQTANPVAGTTLTPDAYFMRRVEQYYKSKINRGYAAVIGEYVYSSSYDVGEGWSSPDIFPGFNLSKVFSNLNVYQAGPPNSVRMSIGAAGNALHPRNLFVNFYNDTVLKVDMSFFTDKKDTAWNIPLAKLLSPNDLPVSVNGDASDVNDRICVSNIKVTYPATWNFNNEKNFYFELKENPLGNYLIINNFNTNSVVPVLYDYNNSRRILGDISTPGQVKFVLAASTDTVRRFNLMSQDASNINLVSSGSFTQTNFVDYSLPANQADYIIISNPVLYNDGSGNNYVDKYRQYRASAAGGGYNAKIYDINQLNDQFGFGIKKHPASVRDFIRFASAHFPSPKYVFIIGRAINYEEYTNYNALPGAEQENLVPSFGYPASDILLASTPGTMIPLIPIGRLGAINGAEVGNYYRKMLEYETLQNSPSHTIADKAWMKNFLHTAGPSTPDELITFTAKLNEYKAIAEDTLMGARVSTFAKSSVAAIEQQQSQAITDLFHEGLGYVKYFGHSSANEIAINLNYPENYTNQGKYPFVHVSGCTVGNYYNYNPARVTGYVGMSLSEKYVLIPQKGSIGFLGSTHFGIEPFLHLYNLDLYTDFCQTMYGNSIGNQIKAVITALGSNPQTIDYYTRIHLEEVNLHGDPALKLYNFAKPDYVIEDQLVKLTPSIISVANGQFNMNVKFMNIGRATNDSIRVTIKQQLPDNSIRSLYNQLIPAPKYMDSVVMNVPINPNTDKGLNKLIIVLDEGNRVDELAEDNNTLTKEFYIFEDALNPVSPYNYSIVNQQNITFYASTASATSGQRQYNMEIDTTELFNSPFRKAYTATGSGGIVQFTPTNLTFSDSTVYYWRTATTPLDNSAYIWNNYSFIYLPNSSIGSNQSHYYQHLKSFGSGMTLNANRRWDYDQYNSYVKIKNGVFPTAASDAQDFEVDIDGSNNIQSVCGISNIIINVFTPFGMVPWLNNYPGTPLYGSDNVCGPTRKWNFQFNILTQAKRKAAMDFLDMVPNGYYVTIRNTSGVAVASNTYAADWQNDTLVYGHNNSLYHRMRDAGFVEIDSFNRPRAFNFIYKKNDNSFIPAYKFSAGTTDKVILDAMVPAGKASGTVTSPLFGPANSWSQFHWRGSSLEPVGDSVTFNVIGVSPTGAETVLYTVDSTQKDVNISAINAVQYPYLKLKMNTYDTIKGTPYQLRYWRLNYTPAPEGAVAPNLLFVMKDTVDQGEVIDFKLAFKNISPVAFDSLMKFNVIVTDRNNVPHAINLPKGKKLLAGDTLVVSYQIDTRNYPGNNTLFVDINPNFDQPEQYHYNNVLFKEFFVREDKFNPLLDVTFDGIHILNKDIVAAKPHIIVRLKDENRFMALSDTSLLKVQVRFPDGSLHGYAFNDTLRFTPANLSTGDNTAMIDFLPVFTQDGEYELIVSGKDVVGNTAGRLDYHVIFTVISKPMISNLLNYPNPFTTQTAFVFTITGSEVPQNMRIQILTISGKIVREITKDELGPIHVGRNITEFKWDGTDMYGSKLANGVYLYRVLTNLNGKSLDKFTAAGDDTDKYFNKGYGKMVLIR